MIYFTISLVAVQYLNTCNITLWWGAHHFLLYVLNISHSKIPSLSLLGSPGIENVFSGLIFISINFYYFVTIPCRFLSYKYYRHMVFVADPNIINIDRNYHCFGNMMIKIHGSPGLCACVKTLVCS